MLPSKESFEVDPLIYPEDEDDANMDELKGPQKSSAHHLMVLRTALLCLTVGIACAMAFSVVLRQDPKPHITRANPPYRREMESLEPRATTG